MAETWKLAAILEIGVVRSPPATFPFVFPVCDLSAPLKVELSEDVVNVRFCRWKSNAQLRCDLLVG